MQMCQILDLKFCFCSKYLLFSGYLKSQCVSQGTDSLIDGRRIGLFRGARNTTGWRELWTQITPRWILDIFYNLKNSGQDLPNEGSNFILSSVEFGH